MAKIIFKNNTEIRDYGKPYIIAELGANHNGDMELAKKMIDVAKKVGCSCVKFQSWTKKSIFSKQVYKDNYFLKDDYRNRKDYSLEEIVEKFSVSENELFTMADYCKKIGINFASTPFSKKEVDFLVDKCHANFIKIASMDLNNYPFLEYVANKNVPIMLSTGLSELAEIDKAVRTIEKAGNHKIILLHCISIYPPDFADIHLNNIIGLRTAFPEYPIGFSDHSIGTDIPLAAVALGACVIEKHFTLDKNMFGWDHKISANPEELAELVKCCNDVNIALGSTRRIVSKAEIKKRDAFRRSIVAARDLHAGEIIKENDLDLKRPGTGIQPEMLKFLIGKKIKKEIKYDTLIKEEDFI